MTTDITELAQSLKAAAEKAKELSGIANYTKATLAISSFQAIANHANVIALVEALEKAQRANAAQDDHINQQQDRIESLEKKNAELGKYAGDLEAIRAAAEKLVRCKGRYHSEQNYRALAALFGVNTPDLPPLENENVHYADAAELESFRTAYMVWSDKTDWVRDDRRFDVVKPLGKHLADVLREYIEHLESRLNELEESHAQVIQSRDHYKRMTEEGLKQLAESRTVTVTLPAVEKWRSFDAVRAQNAYRVLVVNVLTAAGIKWGDN